MTTLDPSDLAALAGRPVVVGGGLAGLVTALELAPIPCVLVTGSALGADCSSDLAQGGLAAAIGPDDSPAQHAVDTITAGAGLCDPRVVERITAEGPRAVARLLALGARLDRAADGTLRLGLEGAHGRRRIVHADGDGTGHELTRAAVAAVRATPSITVLEHTYAVRLTTHDGLPGTPVTGVWLAGREGRPLHLATGRVVLATGGLGALFGRTTNPRGARGSGLALGVRAGAIVRDLEMVQFHPTALEVGLDPMPLVSEAVRGEGALLVTEDGVPVVPDPLAARDVVSRAVWAHLQAGRRVYLDARGAIGVRFPALFPTVTAACRAAGIDPTRDLVPVRPAAHYAMGGLLVDDACRTTVLGLWAVGEVSSTGLHGANRLASNSLLEAVVCAEWAARSIRADLHTRPAGKAEVIEPGPTPDLRALDPDLQARALLATHAGVLRAHAGLSAAIAALSPPSPASPLSPLSSVSPHETMSDARLVSLLLCLSALRRTESRGGHARTDHPGLAAPGHTLVGLADLTLSYATGHLVPDAEPPTHAGLAAWHAPDLSRSAS